MKKLLSLILVMAMVLSLCACGKSDAVKNVEALIKAIGEVTVDSEPAISIAEEAFANLSEEEKAKVSNADLISSAWISLVEVKIEALGEITTESEVAIIAAEEAYNALSENEKALVKNYDTLAAARAALEIALWEQFRASLVGDWVSLADEENTILSLAEDGTTVIDGLKFTWELSEDKNTIKLDGAIVLNFDVSSFFEYVTLCNPEVADALVRKNDAEEIAEKYLTIVELTAENIGEYIGEPVYLGNAVDEWGEETNSPNYYLPSMVIEEGLVYLGHSADFAIDLGEGHPTLDKHSGPYMPFTTWGGPAPFIRRIKGSIAFISAEYLTDVKYSEDGNSRIITLNDGSIITDRCNAYTIGGGTYYKLLADANIDF